MNNVIAAGTGWSSGSLSARRSWYNSYLVSAAAAAKPWWELAAATPSDIPEHVDLAADEEDLLHMTLDEDEVNSHEGERAAPPPPIEEQKEVDAVRLHQVLRGAHEGPEDAGADAGFFRPAGIRRGDARSREPVDARKATRAPWAHSAGTVCLSLSQLRRVEKKSLHSFDKSRALTQNKTLRHSRISRTAHFVDHGG